MFDYLADQGLQRPFQVRFEDDRNAAEFAQIALSLPQMTERHADRILRTAWIRADAPRDYHAGPKAMAAEGADRVRERARARGMMGVLHHDAREVHPRHGFRHQLALAEGKAADADPEHILS
jgi:hypothetical protein